MLYGYGVLALLELGLLVYCALNVITTPESEVRNLPKLLWLALVVLFPVVGGIAWLVAGRPQRPAAAAGGLSARGRGSLPGRPRPGRPVPSSPDDDEEFLRGLRERAEQQRRAAEEQRRAEEQRERERRDGEAPGA